MSHAGPDRAASTTAGTGHPARQGARGGGAPWTGALIGVLAGLLGLAPWLVTGGQLMLQNLWGREVLPAEMPLSLLPLSQYELTTLVALLTVGGAAAGLALRFWRPGRTRAGAWSAAAGVLAVQVTATAQAFGVLRAGLTPGSASDLYFAGLLAGVIASIAASLVALFLLASRSRARAALGVGLMAVSVVSWAVEWVVNLSDVGNVSPLVPAVAHWLPAALVGAALTWCGLHPTRRVLVWVANLVLLWVVPALFTSVNYVFGTRIYLGDLDEMALLARQILAATLGPDGGAGPIVMLALAIALAGTDSLEVLRRRRQAGTTA